MHSKSPILNIFEFCTVLNFSHPNGRFKCRGPFLKKKEVDIFSASWLRFYEFVRAAIFEELLHTLPPDVFFRFSKILPAGGQRHPFKSIQIPPKIPKFTRFSSWLAPGFPEFRAPQSLRTSGSQDLSLSGFRILGTSLRRPAEVSRGTRVPVQKIKVFTVGFSRAMYARVTPINFFLLERYPTIW